MRLFGRQWSLQVGDPGSVGIEYLDARMQFKVQLSGRGGQNLCDLTVSNPDPSLVGALQSRDKFHRLLAGYEDGSQELFQGYVVRGSVQDRRTADEPEIQYQLSSAGRPLRIGTINRSFTGTVSARTIIEEVRKAMGLAADVLTLGEEKTYARGFVAQGAPGPILTDLCRDCGSQWQITDGRLRVWPVGQAARRTADLWAAETGLLEASLPALNGEIRAAALLRPGLRPGDVVRIRDQVWSGDVVCVEVTHAGDTDGETWRTDVLGFRYA